MKNTDTAGSKGYDAGKKVSGIKRHIAVDTQGLPHAIEVTTAEVKATYLLAVGYGMKKLPSDSVYGHSSLQVIYAPFSLNTRSVQLRGPM